MWCGNVVHLFWLPLLGGLALLGCKDGCDADVVQRASAFVDAHQACDSNEDCVIIHDHCGELPGGFCGQLPMNREGATSKEWQKLDAELRDCAPDECDVCLAALVPTCTAGSCRAPE
jgi:hypothetical protein